MNYVTLILTPDYQPASFLPLSVISWEDCMRLLVLDRVIPLSYYEDRFIRSAHSSIQLPAVVVTKNWKGFKRRNNFSRYGLYVRDLYTCQYCGEMFDAKDLTIDHVIPRSQGGKTSWENCVSACHECNSRKANKRWTPINKPWKPDYHALVGRRKNLPFNIAHDSWYDYLGIERPQAEQVRAA